MTPAYPCRLIRFRAGGVVYTFPLQVQSLTVGKIHFSAKSCNSSAIVILDSKQLIKVAEGNTFSIAATSSYLSFFLPTSVCVWLDFTAYNLFRK